MKGIAAHRDLSYWYADRHPSVVLQAAVSASYSQKVGFDGTH